MSPRDIAVGRQLLEVRALTAAYRGLRALHGAEI